MNIVIFPNDGWRGKGPAAFFLPEKRKDIFLKNVFSGRDNLAAVRPILRHEYFAKKTSAGFGTLPTFVGQFVLFPNPTDNELKINFLNEETVVGQVEIFNQLGQKVFVQKMKIEAGEEGILQVGHLQEGVYFLIFKNENGENYGERFLKI